MHTKIYVAQQAPEAGSLLLRQVSKFLFAATPNAVVRPAGRERILEVKDFVGVELPCDNVGQRRSSRLRYMQEDQRAVEWAIFPSETALNSPAGGPLAALTQASPLYIISVSRFTLARLDIV